MLNVKHGGIMFHFLSLWYDLTWDWTLFPRTISEYTTHLVYIIIIFFSFEIFTLALAHGFSLETEWQQVSLSLQDSSQYSPRSQQCCCLAGHQAFFYFLVHLSYCLNFGDCTSVQITIGITVTFVIIIICRVFTSVLANRLSLESER